MNMDDRLSHHTEWGGGIGFALEKSIFFIENYPKIYS